ncbi:MAG: histidine--tRNA ligase [Solirubrobacterales bacterium]|nr:histidine--tRNA ligase [Solirubrobacterales bacterium]
MPARARRAPVIQAPRGTFDVLPDEYARREQLEAHAKRVLQAAGYRRIETPTFEATELFARGIGEATDIVQKEMYTFDDGGGRSLTLRPEGTAPVCRAYIEHGMHKLPQPVKLWYLSSFYRAEAPQRGRYRQFWQVGAEAIGSESPETDAELILLLAELLDVLGVKGTQLKLASLGTPETRADYRDELKRYLKTHEDTISAEVRSRIDLNPMRAFDATDPATRATMTNAPKLMDRLAADDAQHFARVRALLDDAGIRYEIEPTLVRGLDYYTRTTFEFSSDALGAQSGVGGGGRYDRLIEQLEGPPTPACGWAAGVERMLLAAGELPVAPQLVDLFVALAEPDGARTAFGLAQEARRAGLQAQLELTGRSLKGQLRYADRIGARYVAIVGDGGDPTARGRPAVSLRNMESGDQDDVDRQSVIPTILRGSRLS